MSNSIMLQVLTSDLQSELEEYIDKADRLAFFTVATFIRSHTPDARNDDLELVRVHRSTWTAESQKFENILINLKEIYKLTPEMLLNIGGALSSRDLLFLALLVLCQKLHGLSKIKVTELQVRIVEEIVDSRGVETDELVAKLRSSANGKYQNSSEIHESINLLEKIGIISIDGDRLTLKERIIYVDNPVGRSI